MGTSVTLALARATFDDFLSESNQNLKSNYLTFPNLETVVLEEESNLNSGDLKEKYPDWNLIYYEFSNVGFNKKMNQALLYYSYHAGPGAAGGVYLVYKKKRGKWKKRKVIPAWAS
ncbi:MAG: hypothetical protein AAF361_00945 [Bacteroidota bacterium]